MKRTHYILPVCIIAAAVFLVSSQVSSAGGPLGKRSVARTLRQSSTRAVLNVTVPVRRLPLDPDLAGVRPWARAIREKVLLQTMPPGTPIHIMASGPMIGADPDRG
jgi:hypothetical protein